MNPEDYDRMPLNCPNLYRWWHDLEVCEFCEHIEYNGKDDVVDQYSDISSDMSDDWIIESCDTDSTTSNKEDVGAVGAELFYHDEDANCAESPASPAESAEENQSGSITFNYFKQILESLTEEENDDVARNANENDEKEEGKK